MIVEVRKYRAKPGLRDEFVEFFRTRSVPALRSFGLHAIGPMLDLEDPDAFVWFLHLPSMEERDRRRAAFYGSDVWKNELEPIAIPMLESYTVILCAPLDPGVDPCLNSPRSPSTSTRSAPGS